MSTTKEEAMRLISKLPEEVTWDDIMYRLYVKRKIEEGIKAADEGRTISHDQVTELFARE
jgi:predicted transcriptional regulator